MEILSISVTLFLIMDPFGNIPVFLTILFRFFTQRGLAAVARLMGMVLVALSVQLLIDGITGYLTKV